MRAIVRLPRERNNNFGKVGTWSCSMRLHARSRMLHETVGQTEGMRMLVGTFPVCPPPSPPCCGMWERVKSCPTIRTPMHASGA